MSTIRFRKTKTIDGVTYFVLVTDQWVEIGDESGRGDQGAACTKEEFFAGRFHGFILDVFGESILEKVSQVLR